MRSGRWLAAAAGALPNVQRFMCDQVQDRPGTFLTGSRMQSVVGAYLTIP